MNPDYETRVTPAFSVPIYNTNINLEDTIGDKIRKLDFYRAEANNGWITMDTNILDRDNFLNLKLEILSHIHILMHEIIGVDKEIGFKITNSWANKHMPGDWAHNHYHKNSLYSGVVYIETPPDGGNLVLERPYPTLFLPTLELQSDDDSEDNLINLDNWTIHPGRAKLIIFPSYVKHYVTKNNSNVERLTMAFNVWPTGKIGTDGLDTVKL